MTKYFEYEDRLPCKPGKHNFQMNGICHICRRSREELVTYAVATLEELAPVRLQKFRDVIRFHTKRIKPLAELLADDVPQGLDPEDVATDFDPIIEDARMGVTLVESKDESLNRAAERLLATAKIHVIRRFPFGETLDARFELPFIETKERDRVYGVGEIEHFLKRFGFLPLDISASE